MNRKALLASADMVHGAFSNKEAQLSQHLPWSTFIDKSTISTKNGDLMRVFELGGLPFETAELEELDYRSSVREQFIRRGLDVRTGFYHHIIRRRISAPPAPRSGIPFADDLSQKLREQLGARRLYENKHFATIVERSLKVEGVFNSLFRKELDGRSGTLKKLDAVTRSFQNDFEDYDPRLLSLNNTSSGPLDFLGMLANGTWRKIAPARAALATTLSRRAVTFLKDMIVWEGATDSEATYGAVLSLRGYGGFTVAGSFDALMGLNCEFILSQSFMPLDNATALARTKTARRKMRAAEDDAETLALELDTAVNDIASEQLSLGEHQVNITVLASKVDTLTESIETITSLFRSMGAEPIRERAFAETAYWAQLPGNHEYRSRIATITSRNFSDIASFHTHAQGQEEGNHWGEAAALLETTSRCPYWFNWHDRDRGNTVVFGESGSGKTVLINALSALSMHLDQRLFFFDKDRGADPFIRAIDGNYTVVSPGNPTGFNPFSLEDTAENRSFVRGWLAQLLNLETLKDRQRETVAKAVDEIFDAPPQMRRLRNLAELFSSTDDGGELSRRLNPWIHKGECAWLFDDAMDTLDLDRRVSGFDLTTVLDDPQTRSPWLAYVFHRINMQMRDGTRTMIVLDEAWRLLDDEVFQRQLKDWLKTIRKQNGFVVFITQEVEDAANSKIGPTIVSASPTQIFLPNYKADKDIYCRKLGLTDGEFNFVVEASAQSRLFLLKHGKDSVIARLDLGDMPGMIKVLSGRSETNTNLDELRREHGDNPQKWLPHFMKQEDLEDA